MYVINYKKMLKCCILQICIEKFRNLMNDIWKWMTETIMTCAKFSFGLNTLNEMIFFIYRYKNLNENIFAVIKKKFKLIRVHSNAEKMDNTAYANFVSCFSHLLVCNCHNCLHIYYT